MTDEDRDEARASAVPRRLPRPDARTFSVGVPAVWSDLLALTAEEANVKTICRTVPPEGEGNLPDVAADDPRVWRTDERWVIGCAEDGDPSLECHVVLCRTGVENGAYEIGVSMEDYVRAPDVRSFPALIYATDAFGNACDVEINVDPDWAARVAAAAAALRQDPVTRSANLPDMVGLWPGVRTDEEEEEPE